MQRKPIDKALFLGVPAFLLALFILNITAEGEVKLAATLGSVGLCIGFFSYLRSRRFGNRYPIEKLIEKDGDFVVSCLFCAERASSDRRKNRAPTTRMPT